MRRKTAHLCLTDMLLELLSVQKKVALLLPSEDDLFMFDYAVTEVVSSRCMSSSPLFLEIGVIVGIIEFSETQVLEQVSWRVPYAPALSCQSVLVPHDGGNACKRELQVSHMYAAQIYVVCPYETISCIIDA